MTFSSHVSLRALLLGAIGCQAASSDAPGSPTADVVDESTPQADVADAVLAPDVPDGPLCADPAPVLLVNGGPSGFVKCADGAINRVASATFEPVNTGDGCHGDEGGGGCLTDSDCTAGPNGQCNQFSLMFGQYCLCEYACATDDDCAAGSVCVPAELSEDASRPRCVAAACEGEADCPSAECGLVDFFDGCQQLTELRCRDANVDACRGDGDCAHLGDGYTCGIELGGVAFTCVARSDAWLEKLMTPPMTG
jgi:hypothetical protein